MDTLFSTFNILLDQNLSDPFDTGKYNLEMTR